MSQPAATTAGSASGALVIAAGLAAVILGEALTPPLITAAAVILAGTWLAQRSAGRR